MESISSNEFIILRLPPLNETIGFIFQTFGITQYIFYDDRFATKQIIELHSDKFDVEYYIQFREKCIEIEKKEVSFTINEFIFLARTIDFVSKCFIGEPNKLLEKVLNEDFKDEHDFDYNIYREFYLNTATKFFDGFKEKCSNRKLLEKISKELDWKIDI
jgi:hypothetical protein